jgi:acyl-CoA synthetase (AMP-forming)/AMP-acid ligase II
MEAAETLAACRTIGDVVRLNAGRFGDKAALVSVDGETLSFRAFADGLGRLTRALTALGLAPGDRVAILSRNRPEYLQAVCVSAAGLVAVPLNWRLTPAELACILDDCRPAMLLVDRDFAPLAQELGEARPDCRMVCFDETRPGLASYADLLAGAPPSGPEEAVDPDGTACLVYTSGTTGPPKGAELTHRGLLLNCRAAIDHLLQLTPDDVTLAPMPFFHVGGLWYHLFPSFAAGCTTHVLPAFEPGAVIRTVARERVTNLHVVPTMLHGLLAEPNLASSDLGSLRLVFYAASTIPLTLLRRAMATFAGCGFVQGYGSTEAGMVSVLTVADHRAAVETPGRENLLLSCGRALPGVDVRLVDEADGVGEIAVASAMTMARYWRNDSATARVRPDGFLRTGDLARLDDGVLTILDRRSDMIVTGGENVFPREVEEALLLCPDVAEAAVFDLP